MKSLFVLITAILSIQTGMAAEALKTGDTLPNLQLTNQHDAVTPIANNSTRIIFAADNTGASMVTAFLDSNAPTWLTETNSTYLADIHKMPSLITRMFALPQLREKPYTIILGREEADLAAFPRQKGCVSLLAVTQNQIGDIQFACTEDELKAKLK